MFWRQTPRLLDLIVVAKVAATTAAHDRRVEQAWLTAMLGRATKPPALKSLLSKAKPKTKMRWEDMLRATEMWVASHGETRGGGR